VTEAMHCHGLGFDRPMARGLKRSVLKRIDATFHPGRIALITGATGAGKSTLLHLLGGMMRPTVGDVRVGQEAVSRWVTAHRDMWRRNVGIVFQQPHLFDDMTVLENVAVPMIPRGVRLAELRMRALDIISRLGLSHLTCDRAGALSLGECQRVSIARALVCEPSVLLCDEPTAYQDPESIALVLKALADARDRQAVVVVTGHDPRLTQTRFGDDHYMLKRGRLSEL